MKPSILIVDDEAGVRSALSGVLRDEGYGVDAVDSGEACLDRVVRTSYDAIVLDIWLPGMDGLATLAKLQDRRVDAPVIMISGHGNIESAVRAIKMGAFDFVEKPLKRMTIVKSVRKAAERQSLVAENRSLKQFPSSPSVPSRRRPLGLALGTRAVLGTNKETVASREAVRGKAARCTGGCRIVSRCFYCENLCKIQYERCCLNERKNLCWAESCRRECTSARCAP